tara:strand:+ start:302 stop:1234 length:933 start_codon:yes stop_codon:yes gene_type:complete
MRETKNMQENEFYFDDEIDLRELFNVLWTAKKLIILITAIFAFGSVIYSLSLNDYYKSGSIFLARSASGNQGLSQYSGLAAMAGITLPSSSGEDKAAQMIELIKSRKFVKHLMTFENILPSILAAKSYNNSTQELLFNQRLYESETKTWKNNEIPSYLKAHSAYLNMLSIAQDKKTGFIYINIEHISPVFAKDFLELIIRESNELIRKKDMEESKQGLEYLTSELSKTPFVAIKESINALIEVQLETQMMAQINQDYILTEIEPPFIPEQKSKPSRTFICVAGTILGGILSVLIVLIRHYSFGEEDQAVE